VAKAHCALCAHCASKKVDERRSPGRAPRIRRNEANFCDRPFGGGTCRKFAKSVGKCRILSDCGRTDGETGGPNGMQPARDLKIFVHFVHRKKEKHYRKVSKIVELLAERKRDETGWTACRLPRDHKNLCAFCASKKQVTNFECNRPVADARGSVGWATSFVIRCECSVGGPGECRYGLWKLLIRGWLWVVDCWSSADRPDH